MGAVCVIPARGGSKGIPKKNIALLNGKPLIGYTIEAAFKSNIFSDIFVNTDSDIISDICKSITKDISIYKRDHSLSSDDSTILSVLQDFVSNKELDLVNDTITLLQPTSPLRTADDIRSAHQLWNASNAETLVSVVKIPHNMNPDSVYSLKNNNLTPLFPKSKMVTQRQQKPNFYARNGPAILIMRIRNIVSGSLYAHPLIGYEMDWLRSFDIDAPDDLSVIEKLM